MRFPTVTSLFLLAPTAACSPGNGTTDTWSGTMDTLPSGQVVVHNTADPIWPAGRGWRVVEELRIGTRDGDGPDLLGNVTSLDVDPLGRIWLIEGQAQEVRVFDVDGSHVRTIGRSGGGPGEFARALHIQLGPDGHIWVTDPQNNRLSRFDTAGTYVEGRQSPGGFVIMPWPGGFDADGYYYSPVPILPWSDFRIGLVRYDTALVAMDTIESPRSPIAPDRFELQTEDSYAAAGVPFSAGFEWRLAPSGTIWGMLTGEYRFFQLSLAGDTLRSFTREFDPLPVTDEDMGDVREQLEWFVQEGGRIDLGRIPRHKPATDDFFFDDVGNLWVQPVVTREREGRVIHVFDAEGRYLGEIDLPFRVSAPYPVIRGDAMYAVTEDEMEVPYVVRARIEKP